MKLNEKKKLYELHETYKKHQDAHICSCGLINKHPQNLEEFEKFWNSIEAPESEKFKYFYEINQESTLVGVYLKQIEPPATPEIKEIALKMMNNTFFYRYADILPKFIKIFGMDILKETKLSGSVRRDIIIKCVEKYGKYLDLKDIKTILKKYKWVSDISAFLKFSLKELKELIPYIKPSATNIKLDFYIEDPDDPDVFDKVYLLIKEINPKIYSQAEKIKLSTRVFNEYRYKFAKHSVLKFLYFRTWILEAICKGIKMENVKEYLISKTENELDKATINELNIIPLESSNQVLYKILDGIIFINNKFYKLEFK